MSRCTRSSHTLYFSSTVLPNAAIEIDVVTLKFCMFTRTRITLWKSIILVARCACHVSELIPCGCWSLALVVWFELNEPYKCGENSIVMLWTWFIGIPSHASAAHRQQLQAIHGEEQQFEQQYSDWVKQFNAWKEQNKSMDFSLILCALSE